MAVRPVAAVDHFDVPVLRGRGSGSGQHLGPDRRRVLRPRVVVGDDHHVGAAGGGGPHRSTLRRVAVAAAAEHHDPPAAAATFRDASEAATACGVWAKST